MDAAVSAIADQSREGNMSQTIGSVTVEEHQAGDTTWVAVRARGADWSWLTREDALSLARHLLATYGDGQAARFLSAVH
jgi:hypothetical protein